MGEEDVVTEVSEAVVNGTGMPEKTGEALNEKDENGVTEMEEDKKDDEIVGTEQMNLDSEGKVKDAIKMDKEDNSNDAEVVPGPEKEEKLESAKIEEPKAEKEVERDENKPEAMEEEIDSKENAEPEEKNEIEKNEKKVDEPKEEEKVDEPKEEVIAAEPKEEEEIADKPKEEEAIADKPKEEEAVADEPKEEEMVDEPKDEEEMIDEPKEEEMVDEPKEGGEEEEKLEKEDGKGSKKRGKGKSGGQKVKDIVKDVEREPDQKTPFVDRPVRERKSVERLVASVEREYAREFHIEKGPGTALKDIPNVAFKLSRKKTDETFKLLHPILFGRRGKATEIKSNISRFSGFVWRENEEKQKLKVKEKFDKLNKEKLVEICDVLDVPVAKATTRKEDIISKLMEFLVEPHATTSVLLSEKDKPIKGQKRKRGVKQSSSTSASTPSKRSAKKQKKDEDTLEEKRSASDSEDESEEEEKEEEEEENGVAEKSDHEMPEPSESEEKSESEEDSEKDAGKQKRKRSSNKSTRNKEPAAKSRSKKTAVAKKSSPAQKKSTNKAVSKRSKTDDNSDLSPKVFSRKKKTENLAKDKSPVATKPASKEKTGKKVAKGKEKTKGENLKPTDDELRDAITEILKEVDFNTATFTDILKQLAKRFDTDLTPRKSSIKVMIQEELTKLADEGDDEEEEDADAEKDETKTGGEGVVA